MATKNDETMKSFRIINERDIKQKYSRSGRNSSLNPLSKSMEYQNDSVPENYQVVMTKDINQTPMADINSTPQMSNSEVSSIKMNSIPQKQQTYFELQ